jgi:hypothetical protein
MPSDNAKLYTLNEYIRKYRAKPIKYSSGDCADIPDNESQSWRLWKSPENKKSNKTHKTLKPWISNTTPMVLFQNMEVTHAAARLHRVAGKE